VPCSSFAAPQPRSPGFCSPDAVENILRDDVLRDWRARLERDQGLSLGLDYSTNLFGASDSLGEDGAWSGIVRFYGAGELANRSSQNSGALVWKVEHRHRTGDSPISPSSPALRRSPFRMTRRSVPPSAPC
jgi:porin